MAMKRGIEELLHFIKDYKGHLKKNHYLLFLNIMHQSIVFNNTKNNVH